MVDLSPTALMDRARSPQGKKLVRYSMVSVVSVGVSQVVLFIAFYLLHWSGRMSNVVAVCVSAIPSYYLNRAWVWGKRGRSHLWKEVTPFWTMALIGLAFSTWAADLADNYADALTGSRLGQTLVVMAAALGAFGILWIGKFVILNKVLFAHRAAELPPALDGRTGLPT